MSQRKIFEDSDESTSLPEASPAPISARQVEAWDSSEESGVPYGWKCSGSSEIAAQLGYLLRTYLLSALEGLTPFSLAWKKQVTPRGRWWWVLGRSEPHTGEIESGLSEGWSTPTAFDAGIQSGGFRPSRAATGRTTDYLARQAIQEPGGEWPTPMKADGDNPQKLHNHRKDGSNLTLRGALDWATPTSRDEKGPGPKHTKGGRDLATDVGDRKSPGLDQMARGGQLAEENPNTNGSRPGSLNPDWVEALMGAPPGWTDLPAETVSRLWETRTRRMSRT